MRITEVSPMRVYPPSCDGEERVRQKDARLSILEVSRTEVSAPGKALIECCGSRRALPSGRFMFAGTEARGGCCQAAEYGMKAEAQNSVYSRNSGSGAGGERGRETHRCQIKPEEGAAKADPGHDGILPEKSVDDCARSHGRDVHCEGDQEQNTDMLPKQGRCGVFARETRDARKTRIACDGHDRADKDEA